MSKDHHYLICTTWTGNLGKGTSDYHSYLRDHIIKGKGKSNIQGSSDPSFKGDASKYNPEELFLSSISSCHMLWYLSLCAENNIVVTSYSDRAKGIMTENENCNGQFKQVTLYPHVTVEKEEMIEHALMLHNKAHNMCFIANSCNFEIIHQATCSC